MRAVCQSIPVGSEGEYQHIRLSDKPEAAKKRSRILYKRFPFNCYRSNLNALTYYGMRPDGLTFPHSS